MAIKPDPKVIYLSPGCNYDREWCENDVWSECKECGVKSVKYILATDHLNSHRFDEDAERVKFESAHPGMNFNRDHLYPKEYRVELANNLWDAWKACALAREREFAG